MKATTEIAFYALLALLLTQKSAAQPASPNSFASSGQAVGVPDSVVRRYLARSLTVQGVGTLPAADRVAFCRWVGSIGTRFAGRVGGFWLTPRSVQEEQASFDTTRHIVAELQAHQPDMVVQGAIFEIVYAHVDSLPVPNRIRAAFGEDTLRVPARRFRFVDMMYPEYYRPTEGARYRWDSGPPGQAPGVPDMSQTETQKWFYYAAVRQIDAGCEALHFGQIALMDDRDPGHRAWWSMLQRVRAYARTRNRGVVLCDAHTRGEYYDPDPAHPLPDSARQLLFDFHSYPLRPLEADTVRAGLHGAVLEIGDGQGELYARSKGGITPGQQRVARLSAVVEFDNFGAAVRPGRPGQRPWVWGLDEISWFAQQPSAYRDQWLVYAYARVRQLDPAVQLQFPAMRVVTNPPQADYLYRADQTSQGDVFRRCWAGKTKGQGEYLLFIGPPPLPAKTP